MSYLKLSYSVCYNAFVARRWGSQGSGAFPRLIGAECALIAAVANIKDATVGTSPVCEYRGLNHNHRPGEEGCKPVALNSLGGRSPRRTLSASFRREHAMQSRSENLAREEPRVGATSSSSYLGKEEEPRIQKDTSINSGLNKAKTTPEEEATSATTLLKKKETVKGTRMNDSNLQRAGPSLGGNKSSESLDKSEDDVFSTPLYGDRRKIKSSSKRTGRDIGDYRQRTAIGKTDRQRTRIIHRTEKSLWTLSRRK